MSNIRTYEELKKAIYSSGSQISITDTEVKRAVKKSFELSTVLLYLAIALVAVVGIAAAIAILRNKGLLDTVQLKIRDFEFIVKFHKNVGMRTITDMKHNWKITEPVLPNHDFLDSCAPLVLTRKISA
ncbi:MAG: hypothetical protein GXY81_04940 [Candidatus Cloacimonetes bacterium]|nr:hypothetical protein [Candidatus Cloacimonadota bacterium]